MAKFLVRFGVAHVLDEDGATHAYPAGKVVELTEAQFEEHKHQVEPYVPPSKEKIAA